MKLTYRIIILINCILFICSCSTFRMTNRGALQKSKRTVTFKVHNANRMNGVEEAIASCFKLNENDYFPNYVEVNYDSTNMRFDSLYSSLNYWNKTRVGFSRKRQYRLYADATGTDHLLDMDIRITYDTIRTAQESDRLWDHLWENNNPTTKELVGAKEAHFYTETYNIKKIKYKLRYIDGHSGKTLWSMRCHWPTGLLGLNKENPVLLIKEKFEKKFPYKLDAH